MKYRVFAAFVVCVICMAACRKDDMIVGSTDTSVTQPSQSEVASGFYLLNEGNMGSNKATLDYFDYATGIYSKNIFAERNPTVVGELGDVGNDLQIYGSKLYAVINCSNLVEVMAVESAEHYAQISVPNCRNIAFDGGYAYVSSYAGPVQLGDPNARLGYVAKIDTVTMTVVDTCTVGYQPDELVVVDDRIYVANSGGYLVGEYDYRLSVIDINTFTEIEQIEVAINLHNLVADDHGSLWVGSLGDYADVESCVYQVDLATSQVVRQLDVKCSQMALAGDSLYLFGYDDDSFVVVDVSRGEVVDRMFITDGTQSQITTPYGLAVNAQAREIFITDAKDYVTPGTLHCYDMDSGVLKWSVTTGDIPAHIAFTNQQVDSDTDADVESEPTPAYYITKVFDYCPAPGQYVNILPAYESGDTQSDMNDKVLASIGYGVRSTITLGGYGGYVVVGFDQQIENRDGLCDFRVLGNAFFNSSLTGDAEGGSCEPAIIMVSQDTNQNGLPDDEWYEIAGSAHRDFAQEAWYQTAVDALSDTELYYDYQITYSRPDSEPAEESYSDYIAWYDNKGGEGYISKLKYNAQAYYPEWITADTLSLSGTRLPHNAISSDGVYVLYKFDYGYGDNDLNNSDGSAIDISWAVDAAGDPVVLSGVDFVKIYSGVNQQNGALGECSSEVMGVEDLHLLGDTILSLH